MVYIKGEYSDFYKKKIAYQLKLISDSSTGVKLYKVTADYRKNNPNKSDYYVLGKSSKEAKQRFKSHPAYSHLDIYDIEVCENSLAKEIISEPIKHFVV